MDWRYSSSGRTPMQSPEFKPHQKTTKLKMMAAKCWWLTSVIQLLRQLKMGRSWLEVSQGK
jgi:hypothetical protein